MRRQFTLFWFAVGVAVLLAIVYHGFSINLGMASYFRQNPQAVTACVAVFLGAVVVLLCFGGDRSDERSDP